MENKELGTLINAYQKRIEESNPIYDKEILAQGMREAYALGQERNKVKE